MSLSLSLTSPDKALVTLICVSYKLQRFAVKLAAAITSAVVANWITNPMVCDIKVRDHCKKKQFYNLGSMKPGFH